MPPTHAKKVFTGQRYTVWQWPQKLYDGSVATFEGIERPDYAGVIGVLPDKKILLIQDEQPDRDAVLTQPGGRVEPGEDPAVAAARELREETGYEAGSLHPWFSYAPNRRSEWQVTIFIGRNLKKIAAPKLEPGERIEPKTFTFTQFLKLGRSPQLRDLMLRIHLLEAELDPQKKLTLREMLYGK